MTSSHRGRPGILIDSDNALGSPFGDVDDAFAIAALLRSPLPVIALSSVAGNTSERRAFANNCSLARRLDFAAPILHGSEVPAFLRSHPGTTVLALGPLTNVAAAVREEASLGRVLLVGGTLSTSGRWPPLWPHEFNLTQDRRAALEVFHSGLDLTFFPLDVVRQLAVTRAQIQAIGGPIGEYLSSGAKRWLMRLLLLKGSRRFPVYDLAAAAYLIDPSSFLLERTTAAMRSNTLIEFDRGSRPVDVCRRLDPQMVWAGFVRWLGRQRHAP